MPFPIGRSVRKKYITIHSATATDDFIILAPIGGSFLGISIAFTSKQKTALKNIGVAALNSSMSRSFLRTGLHKGMVKTDEESCEDGFTAKI